MKKFRSEIITKTKSDLYYLYYPLNSQNGKKYPLLIFLHGWDETAESQAKIDPMKILIELTDTPPNMAHDNEEIVKEIVIAAPQMVRGYNWNLYLNKTSKDRNSKLENKIIDMIDDIKKTSTIDENRIYLTGISMGGAGTIDIGSRFSCIFAALAPICSANINTEDRKKRIPNILHIPIWIGHSKDDSCASIEGPIHFFNELRKKGSIKCIFDIYNNVPGYNGHYVWILIYRNQNFWDWLLQQKK